MDFLTGRAFDRLNVKGKPVEPLDNLNMRTVSVSTLDDVVSYFRGNMSETARLLGVDRGWVYQSMKSRRVNFVAIFDAGDGKVIYKILK